MFVYCFGLYVHAVPIWLCNYLHCCRSARFLLFFRLLLVRASMEAVLQLEIVFLCFQRHFAWAYGSDCISVRDCACNGDKTVCSPCVLVTYLCPAELSETILKTFSTEYTKAYIIALLEKIRDEVTEEPEDWKLMQRPEVRRLLLKVYLLVMCDVCVVEESSWHFQYAYCSTLLSEGMLCLHLASLQDDGPTEPLKEGYMTKQGGNIKTWRRRYFVVLPDYRVEYYETQEVSIWPVDFCGNGMGWQGSGIHIKCRCMRLITADIMSRISELLGRMLNLLWL